MLMIWSTPVHCIDPELNDSWMGSPQAASPKLTFFWMPHAQTLDWQAWHGSWPCLVRLVGVPVAGPKEGAGRRKAEGPTNYWRPPKPLLYCVWMFVEILCENDWYSTFSWKSWSFRSQSWPDPPSAVLAMHGMLQSCWCWGHSGFDLELQQWSCRPSPPFTFSRTCSKSSEMEHANLWYLWCRYFLKPMLNKSIPWSLRGVSITADQGWMAAPFPAWPGLKDEGDSLPFKHLPCLQYRHQIVVKVP